MDHVGKLVGCLLTAYFLDKIGRKLSICCCATVFFFAWIGITFANTVWLICCLRLFIGVAIGGDIAISSIYIGEVTSARTRGVFCAVILCLRNIGLLSEYVIAHYLPYRVTSAVNAVIGLLTIFSTFWLVESPHFLLAEGRVERAESSLMWLRGVTAKANERALVVLDEFNEIKRNVEYERQKKKSYRGILGSSENYRSLLIVSALFVLSGGTGYMPVVTYSSIMFSSTKMFTKNEFTILLGVLQCVMVLIGLFVISRCHRRPLLLISYSCICVFHAFSAALYYVHEHVAKISGFPWIIFGSVSAYMSLSVVSYPAIFAAKGEILPLSVKAIGGCVSVICTALTNFAFVKIFMGIVNEYGMHTNFIIYSVISLILVAFMYVWLPETRNKTLTQIQEELRSKANRSYFREEDSGAVRRNLM